MTRQLTVFMADYLPLANKGEEAILRGVQDMLGGPDEVEVGILSPVSEAGLVGDVHVFPYEWVYRVSGQQTPRRRRARQHAMICIQQRLGLYGRLRRLAGSRSSRYRPLRSFFERSDLIVVGHDGLFCPETCGVIHMAHLCKKPVGILGAGIILNPRMRKFALPLYRRAVQESLFCVLRERKSYELMRDISGSDKPRLAPDPAFAMQPASRAETTEYLEGAEFYRMARRQGRPVVGVTTCEKSVVFRASFLDIRDVPRKRGIHARFVAEILDCLIRERGVAVMFLPHSIEPGIGNDVYVARAVQAEMKAPSESHWVLDDDISPRLLKGIIGVIDFLIGERTHSLIGGVSTATPFVGLTNTIDQRTHDIIGDMSRAADQLLNMDRPDVREACRQILQVFDRREQIHKKLLVVRDEHKAQLADVATMIRKCLPNE